MEKKVDTKFTWVIKKKNFSSLQSRKIVSDTFNVGGCKWRLSAYPKGYQVDNFLSLYLEVADYGSLPSGWGRHTQYTLTVVNQCSEELSRRHELKHRFDEKSNSWGISYMLPLSELHDNYSGFLVNGELEVVADIFLLEIIGKVEFVSRMFEKHPEIASGFRIKNQNLRTGYMNLLLSLIDTLRQSPHKLPKDHMDEAYDALVCLTNAGFKLDWLKKKLDQVPETKEKVKANEIRMQETQKELKLKSKAEVLRSRSSAGEGEGRGVSFRSSSLIR
ncbi:unnamed protein product [Thlaspi arvense]|uniref:MATH domain-containing protein n=1 Tax=Thlaspi arvense TaxID=13288 RepID=A0AAU9SHK8_THLAR|nr:unnamed protein product [Thlaspi arvense]